MLFRKKQNRVGGYIGLYGLQDWWFNELTLVERETILYLYNPMGSSSESLISGEFEKSLKSMDIEYSTHNVVFLLSHLSGWFKKPEYRHIGYEIIRKAEELLDETIPLIDTHFLYHAKIELYYRNRDVDNYALSKAIDGCNQQIMISEKAIIAFQNEDDAPLPGHTGFKQLCIIKEKQKDYISVIKIAEMAMKQGWSGDWEKRINRCRKKMG